MEDSSQSSKDSLSGWALVNSQGELMQADGESDSSESSIEVVSVEGNDIVSFHQSRRESAGPLADQKGEVAELCLEETSEKNIEDSAEQDKHVIPPPLIETSRETIVDEDFSLSTTATIVASFPASFNTEAQLSEVEKNDAEVTISSDPGCTNFIDSPSFLSKSLEADLTTAAIQSIQELEQDEKTESVMHNVSSTGVSAEELTGACCKELLHEDERDEIHTNTQGNANATFCADDVAQTELKESAGFAMEGESEVSVPSQVSSKTNSMKDESDSDSDFVRLDADNVDIFEAHGIVNPVDQLPPAPLLSRSSIDENFSFMRGQDIRERNIQPPQILHDVDGNDGFDGDIDRDDETESSTEEGFDDRIESEQSEAGSHPALNDVGDLSAFADIGDIPLEVGDVRRNYIHCPNNRLSSVLNVILVLATILTMGISLGIIMATDLEIEEWQNAYELQTMRVKQLELQLRERENVLEKQNAKVAHLEALSKHLKFKMADPRDQILRYKKTEKALDWLEARGIVEGGHFSHATHLVRGIIQVFINCEEDLDNSADSDNISFVPANLCSSQLEDYVLKLKDLAYLKRPPLSKQEALNFNVESEKTSLLPGYEMQENHESNYEDTQIQAPEDEDSHRKPSSKEDLMTNSKEGENQADRSSQETSKVQKFHDHEMVDIDIQQLQQSLSREQERALHWQHLYLFERRQRERERENEEWEDERDREQWQKEWEQEKVRMAGSKQDVSEVECLKKILASNFTTLTQHVAKWNVSVFDDFANLSILLHSVQDLKQSVVNSVSKVWESAEEVLEKISSGSKDNHHTESDSGKDFVSQQELIARYLLEVMHSIRESSGKQLETLLTRLHYNLDKIKQSLESVGQEMNSDTVANLLEKAWSITGITLSKLQQDVVKVVPEKEVLVRHLRYILENLEINFDVEDPLTQSGSENKHTKDAMDARKDDFDPDFDDINEEDDDDEDDDEEENDIDDDDAPKVKNEKSWSHGFKNILSKTRKSFQQFGKKVSRTFNEFTTIWNKKKMPLIRIAKRLTSKFVRASVKLTKMCTKLPATLFQGHLDKKDGDEVFIHSKCIKKLRKQWQKQLLENQCEAAGRLSFECNSDRKTLKREIKEISKLFSQLLKIKTFQPTDAVKLSKEDATLHYELFKSFLERWGGRSLLLKKDLEWAVCQRDWWSQVVLAIRRPNSYGSIHVNSCDVLSSGVSFFPGGSVEELNKLKSLKKRQKTKRDKSNAGADKADKKVDTARTIPHEIFPNLDNETSNYESSDNQKQKTAHDRYLVQEKYRIRQRKGGEKRLGSDKMSGLEKQNRISKRSENWFLKKAGHRKHQREEHSRSDWLFERAKHRRHCNRKGQNDEQDEILIGKRRYLSKENWILKHGHYRQHQRNEEHRADWVFDRASDRKEHHQSTFQHCD
ncbi:hypothetical protein PoB_003313000 [Plakobranchus ocellatus]|uniref:Uncharacterized protein n=1 Tax=Plakobranchus ocellatus TaxID=259542 RepID=A0AAV4AEM2_9GAST|nr:hypothetical protein PoB_003313000 [Plakobranchus ocellatus]